jgi:hypothetical protein
VVGGYFGVDTVGESEDALTGYQWRPDRARACEYLADFERIGRHALRRPEWKGRLKLFEIYFLGSFEYKTAIRLVGVAPGTFDYWYREVKRSLGAEFSRTGLFPPRIIFRRCAASSAPREGTGPVTRSTSHDPSRAMRAAFRRAAANHWTPWRNSRTRKTLAANMKSTPKFLRAIFPAGMWLLTKELNADGNVKKKTRPKR